jgi:glycyl-tRNA synthetase (class II)
LIGVPVRLTVSKKTLEHKAVEVKNREEKDLNLVPLDSVVSSLNRG